MSDAKPSRWEYYVLLDQERLPEFWVEHLRRSQRSVLVILGRGFDPRMTLGLKMLLEAGGDGPRDVLGLDFREGRQSPSLDHHELVTRN